RRALIRSATSSFFVFYTTSDSMSTLFYTLSLLAALPILQFEGTGESLADVMRALTGEGNFAVADFAISGLSPAAFPSIAGIDDADREEHTSELQSRENLVCRLLLEKKNTQDTGTDKSTHP